ncbi:MAG TPA: hypothetical protein VKY74_15470 [Chloroflexia bacterium]|nr:hypothetical protein [Chloroflexia bacterium]
MNKLYGIMLSLLVLVPVAIGCDSGAVGTAVTTNVPTTVAGAGQATMTALPTNISGAATAATTAVNGALTPQDTAYLTKVQALATQLIGSPELADALKATGDAATAGATGGTVDTQGLTDKLTKASTFVDGIAKQAAALQPTPNTKAVQDELMKPVTDWQGALSAAQKAVGAQNWAAASAALAQMTQGVSDAATLAGDLAARGMK